jgi:hypothetical protein
MSSSLTKYSEFCRNLLDNPDHYDNVIALLVDSGSSEASAINEVNTAIGTAMSCGDGETANCAAWKIYTDKIVLYQLPTSGEIDSMGWTIRQRYLPVEPEHVVDPPTAVEYAEDCCY